MLRLLKDIRRFRIGYIFLVVILAGCNKPDQFQKEFEGKFPKPEWFEAIDAPSVDTAKDVSSLWSSEKRCCGDPVVKKNLKIMYKSCYNAILRKYNDDDLVVRCLPKMIYAADPLQRHELMKFLVETYGNYKEDITRCSNCMEADTIARANKSLALYEYRSTKNEANSIRLIEALMDKREKEISPWIQAEIFEFLGDLYLKEGVTPDVKERYQKIRLMISEDVKANKIKLWRLKNFEKVHKLIMAR